MIPIDSMFSLANEASFRAQANGRLGHRDRCLEGDATLPYAP